MTKQQKKEFDEKIIKEFETDLIYCLEHKINLETLREEIDYESTVLGLYVVGYRNIFTTDSFGYVPTPLGILPVNANSMRKLSDAYNKLFDILQKERNKNNE